MKRGYRNYRTQRKQVLFALWKFQEKKKWRESLFKAIMAENLPNLGKERYTDPRGPKDLNRLNSNRAKSRHFTVKCQQSNTFESSKRKVRLQKREPQIRLKVDLSTEIFRTEIMGQHIQNTGRKKKKQNSKFQQRILYPGAPTWLSH